LPGNLSPFHHAGELLAAIKDQGLACVIISNTWFRDAELYRLDFEAFGWGPSVDGYITSVDAGCHKPDERIFRMALQIAEAAPHRCVMVGNSEEADIVPALRLGMRAIRVAIEEPAPAVTQAGACLTSLDQVPDVLREWQRG
jgi:FMN phosphatase YigB (HAD superfamily)